MTTPTQSDSAFQRQLAAAREGDERAFADLFQNQWDALWNLASGQLDFSLQPKQAASDIVQESFLDARRSIADFRGSSRAEFQAWLRTIVNHNVHDAWRHFVECQKRDASREISLDAAVVREDLLTQGGTSPSENLRTQEQQAAIARALEQLPEHYRSILRMRYWDQRTFEEIGNALGKSADAVRQSWYRAIDHFSRLIDDSDA